MTDTSLASLLLTNRIVDVGAKPLTSGEFWALCRSTSDLSLLVGMSVDSIRKTASVSLAEAERYAELLSVSSPFASERQRLEEQGILLTSALDDGFPKRLRHRLRDACPPFLFIAGPKEFLSLPAIGVVGSRDASAEALNVAAAASKVASRNQLAVVSGLARGIDQAAMGSALDASAPMLLVPTEGIEVVLRRAEMKWHAHREAVCIASPYAPSVRFTAGNAMGRNKIIYALAQVTLVVCSASGSGGTWSGAREAMRRNFGRVAVWVGEGAGPGNSELANLGGVAVNDLYSIPQIEPIESASAVSMHPSLFE